MENTLVPKRPREEAQLEKDLDFEEYSKRHKPYNHIISLLDSDSEEENSTEDLSPLMTTLQQEITCPSDSLDALLMGPAQEKAQENLTSLEDSLTSTHVLKAEEDEKDKVMRHLLEASDDELGIPNRGDDAGWLGFGEELGLINSSGDEFSSLCDKLWEIEDERANYYALLQSEIFLWGQ